MTIQNSAAYSQAWHKFFATITTLTDPGGKTKWVYATFPNKKISDKQDYPLVVISPVEIEYEPLTFKNLKRGSLSVTIIVYSTSASQLDTLSDQIAEKMEDNDSEFTMSGITAIRMTNSSNDYPPRDKFGVHNKAFTYEFDYGWF